MPQTKDQKRRNAIDLKREAIAHHTRHVGQLRRLIDLPPDANEAERLLAHDREIHEHRKGLVAMFTRKIQAHERDIANTEAKLSFQP